MTVPSAGADTSAIGTLPAVASTMTASPACAGYAPVFTPVGVRRLAAPLAAAEGGIWPNAAASEGGEPFASGVIFLLFRPPAAPGAVIWSRLGRSPAATGVANWIVLPDLLSPWPAWISPAPLN